MEGVVQRLGRVTADTLIPVTVKAEQFFHRHRGRCGQIFTLLRALPPVPGSEREDSWLRPARRALQEVVT
jgi:hypothetical protein